MKFIIMSLVLLNTAYAKVLQIDSMGQYSILKEDLSVSEFVRDYAEINNYNLIMDEVPKGELLILGVRTIQKKDIDLFLSSALSEIGFTLISNSEINQIRVIPSRNIRYDGGKLYTSIADVPENYNYTMFSMRLKHIKSHDVARSMRPFMSRYARILDEKNTNTLIISDTGKNIRRLYKLITSIDTIDYVKKVNFLEEINRKNKVVIEANTSFLEFLKDQHVLFIIAFSLIAGMIGFGTRGYLIKRIEGGW